MIAMIICVGGVVLIAYMDEKNSEGNEKVLGDIIGVSSAILQALYCVLLSKMIPVHAENEVSFINILGYIGILCLVTFWPLLLIFHWTDIEKFELPTGLVWLYLSINIVFGTLLYDY